MPHALESLGLLVLGTRLRVLSEQMIGIVKAYYEQHGLEFEPRCFPVIHFVRHEPGISLMALSQKIGISHAGVNALCKPLLDAGLIRLEANPDDARAKMVSLTDAGEVMFTRLEPAWHILREALNTALPGAEGEAVLNRLSHLDNMVEDAGIQRGLKQVLNVGRIRERLKIVPYDPGNADHKRYFAALNIEWLETYFSVEPVDYAMFADPKAMILDQDGVILMAMVDQQIVGTGALIKRSDAVYELAKMAVSKPFQGKGIGVLLVDALTEAARAKGLKKLYLVSSTKLPHAVPMYRKLGFGESEFNFDQLYERADITLEKVI